MNVTTKVLVLPLFFIVVLSSIFFFTKESSTNTIEDNTITNISKVKPDAIPDTFKKEVVPSPPVLTFDYRPRIGKPVVNGDNDSIATAIRKAYSFMADYQLVLDSFVQGTNEFQGYGKWGYDIDHSGLSTLNNTLSDCVVAFRKGDFKLAGSTLILWHDEWFLYDQQVSKMLASAQKQTLEDSSTHVFPAIDTWIASHSALMTPPDLVEWGRLKASSQKILSTWTNTDSNSEAISDWQSSFVRWKAPVEKKANLVYKKEYDAWRNSMYNWIGYADGYLTFETASIVKAQKEGRDQSDALLSYLNSQRPLLEKIKRAFTTDMLDEVDQDMTTLRNKLFDKMSFLSKARKESFSSLQDSYTSYIAHVKQIIQSSSLSSADKERASVQLGEDETLLRNGGDALHTYCADLSNCPNSLDEYSGFVAQEAYSKLQMEKNYWDSLLKQHKLTN